MDTEKVWKKLFKFYYFVNKSSAVESLNGAADFCKQNVTNQICRYQLEYRFIAYKRGVMSRFQG